MRSRFSQPAGWVWLSPWMIIGSVCVLAGILLFLAAKNIDRERDFITRALFSQANVLMRSIEASSRTGMMGNGWGGRQLQLLMEETSQQPDVLYAAIVDLNGRVLAHSNQGELGKVLPLSLPGQGKTVHRFSAGEKSSFEVIRAYQPWLRQRGGGHWESWCARNGYEGNRSLFIMVGLDPTPFEEAHEQDMRQTIVLFLTMFLVGAAGLVSIVWAQHYRNARCSLQDIQAFTATIVNQMPVGLIAADLDGRIQRANNAARAILRNHSSLKNGDIEDIPGFLPVINGLKKAESVVEQEILCRMNRVEAITLLVNAAVIRDGGNRPAGHILLFSDTTNIKQLEEQLRRSERLAGLGRLASGIAHEIRNPLSSIKGFATILAGRSRDDERSREIAEIMVQEVERLNRVVTELLDFAKPTELARKSSRFKDLVQHSVQLIERDARHHGVKIGIDIEPEDLSAEVDPDRFTQILLNLYLNSLQAMENGGSLDIKAFRQGEQAVVSVKDTGVGIAEEHIAHIFDPYFTTKARGVGLGLANVHKFVEAHGGEIEVESSPGEGMSISLRLPLNVREDLPLGA